jgi:ubiquinone/menaquinone biosynthesis C-methylase UbiE
MTEFNRQSEQTYYDSFFHSSEAEELDEGVGFKALRGAQARFLKQKIKSSLPAHNILSIGCGNGEIEMLLADPYWHLAAFDLSFAGPRRGQARTCTQGVTGLSFGQAGIVHLPITSEQCDVVLALSVLHHLSVDGRRQALDEAYRVLRPGGWFIAYDPSRWRVLRLAKFLVRQKYDALHSPDEEELSPREMRRLARVVGFASAKAEYFDHFIDPLTWLFPNMHPRLFNILYQIDRVAVRLPGKQLASNFFLIATKKRLDT